MPKRAASGEQRALRLSDRLAPRLYSPPMASQESSRAEALKLAEELLSEIELSKIAPIDIARKASRLARLTDDTAAMQWLHYEVSGYPKPLAEDATAAAQRSNRLVRERLKKPGDGPGPWYWTQTLGELQAAIEASRAQIVAAADPPVSLSSSNPHQHVIAPAGNKDERIAIRGLIARQQAILDNVVGSLHAYVADRYQELRFGSAVESAFEVVRREVDSSIGDLVPDALPMLSAAFENATSSNPEHWANAAGTCRRLLKAVADKLRPPGPDVDGRKMGEGNYINRLVDWIVQNSESETATKVVTTDLAYLGQRLDAADGAGQKGAHEEVDRFDASRFITGTYLILGDVLRIAPPPLSDPSEEVADGESDGGVASATDEPPAAQAMST